MSRKLIETGYDLFELYQRESLKHSNKLTRKRGFFGHSSGISCKSFKGANNSAEHFFIISAPAEGSFPEQLEILLKLYRSALREQDLGEETAIFRRIFLSDILNQSDAVCESQFIEELSENPVSTSMIQQCPLSGAKIGLLAYHIESPEEVAKEFIAPRHMLMEKNGTRHLWSAGPWVDGKPAMPSPAAETSALFDELIHVLESQGATLRDHCVRTWLFIKDVDFFTRTWSTAAASCSRGTALPATLITSPAPVSRGQARTGSTRLRWTPCPSSTSIPPRSSISTISAASARPRITASLSSAAPASASGIGCIITFRAPPASIIAAMSSIPATC